MAALPEPREVTALLRDWSGGDREALERLMPLVYGELRRLAASYLRRRGRTTRCSRRPSSTRRTCA